MLNLSLKDQPIWERHEGQNQIGSVKCKQDGYHLGIRLDERAENLKEYGMVEKVPQCGPKKKIYTKTCTMVAYIV